MKTKENNSGISPEALKKSASIDLKRMQKEKEIEIKNKQIKFAIEYKICPICSKNLSILNKFLGAFSSYKCYCKTCKKIFSSKEIDEDNSYY